VERLMEFEHVLMEGDGTAGAKAVGHMWHQCPATNEDALHLCLVIVFYSLS
jgi:hypothetical protein